MRLHYAPADTHIHAVTDPDDVPPPWNPWRYLAEHHPDVELVTDFVLPKPYMGFTVFSRRLVFLDRYLNQNELRSTLAHEIAHLERGPAPRRERMAVDEEWCCDFIASRRLIRTEDLARVLARFPDHKTSWWASRLWVDEPMLQRRFNKLDSVERSELVAAGVDVDHVLAKIANLAQRLDQAQTDVQQEHFGHAEVLVPCH